MQQYPKCRTCKHSKSKHRLSFGVLLQIACLDCYNFIQNGPTYDWEMDNDYVAPNAWHPYIPDNLTYIEKLAERRGLV
jgi:hypothetical protein